MSSSQTEQHIPSHNRHHINTYSAIPFSMISLCQSSLNRGWANANRRVTLNSNGHAWDWRRVFPPCLSFTRTITMVPSSSNAPRKRALLDGSDVYQSVRKKAKTLDDASDPTETGTSNDAIAYQTQNRSVSQSSGNLQSKILTMLQSHCKHEFIINEFESWVSWYGWSGY